MFRTPRLRDMGKSSHHADLGVIPLRTNLGVFPLGRLQKTRAKTAGCGFVGKSQFWQKCEYWVSHSPAQSDTMVMLELEH